MDKPWQEWTAEDIVPLWEKHGVKPKRGQFYHRTSDGEVYACAIGVIELELEAGWVPTRDSVDLLWDQLSIAPDLFINGVSMGFDGWGVVRPVFNNEEYRKGLSLGAAVRLLLGDRLK